MKIHLNQLGYTPNCPKTAVVPESATTFALLQNGQVVLTGETSAPIYDAASEETVRTADFSAITQVGEYVLEAGEEKSYPFPIAEKPYAQVRKGLLDMFHYQKCGIDLDCGLWSHPACHTSPATIYGTSKTKEVSGGWHDAGDYGRYIVAAAMTVADLLLAHELSPNPDNILLAETWYEI